jgi:hypothetical protein
MYRISSRRQPTRGSPLAWELGEGLIIPNHKKSASYETLHMKSYEDLCVISYVGAFLWNTIGIIIKQEIKSQEPTTNTLHGADSIFSS